MRCVVLCCVTYGVRMEERERRKKLRPSSFHTAWATTHPASKHSLTQHEHNKADRLLGALVSHPGCQARFDPFGPSTAARSRQAPGKKAPPPRSLDSGPKIAIWNRPNSRPPTRTQASTTPPLTPYRVDHLQPTRLPTHHVIAQAALDKKLHLTEHAVSGRENLLRLFLSHLPGQQASIARPPDPARHPIHPSAHPVASCLVA